ncbi:hypothetical protein ASPACDRAFT_47063 [Aspergillus aculeatus ATCC 16872]|uniref:Uncharacterized protein n=1 Tax=Aspergillus aculeatus (strain ATCC 16872 / CBS 172.66 / WB 5094) TaxID=690307 RepID=A0A1L9WJF5_ASPA1|nr:uncharacterized protein ASPACDRAFT_47063 [Aspergillus aculeatus ATCC 16872]OJJ96292.1 hypothetical protein ASPACDRAFT_47063 [Aspergillus aculeatus ATCC 16872]
MNMGGGAVPQGVCSRNTTGATVNGRLLHHFDTLKLMANGVPLGLGPLWINNDGLYGLANSFTPIGRINIYNMIVRSFPWAEAFSPTHLDGTTRAHLEKELEELLLYENTRSYARHPHDDFSTRSYYRRPATSLPDPGTPHQSEREARARREHERQAQMEREEKIERERRERREREERFRREQQDREERGKKEQQEREAKARRDGEERRQGAKAAQEAKAKRWKEYNSAWEELKNSTVASRRSMDPRTSIPWPTEAGSFRSCRDVAQSDIEAFLHYGASMNARSQLLSILKVERLRWHPDKLQHLFCARVDETTINKVTEISQIVNQLYTYEQARRA